MLFCVTTVDLHAATMTVPCCSVLQQLIYIQPLSNFPVVLSYNGWSTYSHHDYSLLFCVTTVDLHTANIKFPCCPLLQWLIYIQPPWLFPVVLCCTGDLHTATITDPCCPVLQQLIYILWLSLFPAVLCYSRWNYCWFTVVINSHSHYSLPLCVAVDDLHPVSLFCAILCNSLEECWPPTTITVSC